MSKGYTSKLEGVDPERGDTFICEWSGVIRQLADFPTPDKAGRVIQAFVRWGKGGERETLSDPWENAVLDSLIAWQISKTKDFFRTCHNREWKDKKRDTYVETSIDKHTQVLNKTKSEDKDNRREISLSSEGDDKTRTDAALASPFSAEDAKKTLAMFAPEIMSHSELLKDGKQPTDWTRKYLAATADASLLMIAKRLYPDDFSEKDEAISEILDGSSFFDDLELPNAFFKSDGGKFIRSALAVSDTIYNAYDSRDGDHAIEKSDKVFKRALLDGYISTSKNPSVKNPTAWILSRLQKVATAVTRLESAKPLHPGD